MPLDGDGHLFHGGALPQDWCVRIVELAAKMFDAPLALLTTTDTPLARPCAVAVKRDDVCALLATFDDPARLVDPAFAEPHFAFHAAVPLDTPDGQRLGMLCVLDTAARSIGAADLERLRDLAALTVHQAEFRIAVDRMARGATALRAVSDGVNPVTGDRFFRTLVLQLTHTLGVDVAFVAESVGGGRGARTIAWCADGMIQDNFVYPLPGTPCAVLWTEMSCVVPAEVQQRFPDDPVLKQLGVESYLGVRLQGTGAGPLGWLGVMHRRPIDSPELAETILKVFASRASAEMERRRSELALRVFQEQLERRFAERTAALRAANERLADQVVQHRSNERALGLGPSGKRLDLPPRAIPHWAAITRFEDGQVLEISDSFLRRFGYARDEVVGRTVHELGIWVTPADRARLLSLLEAKGAVRDFNFDVRTKTGEVRTARLAGDLLGTGDGRFILAVADDVTDEERDAVTPV